MSDLTDEELTARLKYAMGEPHLEAFVEPLRELQRHRAAARLAAAAGLSADDVDTLLWSRGQHDLYIESGKTEKRSLTNTERAGKAIALLDRLIASRAADQLATAAGLSAEDVEAIRSWREHAIYDRLDDQAAMDAIDRLIARGAR